MFKKYTFDSLPWLIVYWCILTLIAFAPYVFNGDIISPGADAVYQYYPALSWYSKALASNDSFLWNPTIYSGFPSYLSQTTSGYIEPINYALFKLIPSYVTAYHLRLVLDCVLVMLFSFLAGRAMQISRLAAFFIGPAYLLSFHWWYLSNTVIANSLFLLPFLIWCYLRARVSELLWKRLLWGIVGGVGVGWAFLGGYAQLNVYALCLVGIIALSDYFFVIDRTLRTVREAVQLAAVLALFASIGFIIASPLILASTAYVPLSIRDSGVDFASTQLKTIEIQELVFFLLPDYLRLPFLSGGKKTFFIGTLSLLFALVAIIRFRSNRYAPMLTGIFVLTFSLAIPNSPLYHLLHALPVFDLFRYPYRWMYLGIWMLCVLGAIGFDVLREDMRDQRIRLIALISGSVAGMFGILVIVSSFFGDWFWRPIGKIILWAFQSTIYSPIAYPKGLEYYAGSADRGIDAWRELASISNPYFTAPIFLMIVSCLIFGFRAYNILGRRYFEILASLVLIATFVGIFVVRWPDRLPATIYTSAHNTFDGVIPLEEYVQYRIHPFIVGYQFRPKNSTLLWNSNDVLAGTEFMAALAAPNINQGSGIPLTDGNEVFASRDMLYITAVLLGSTYTTQDLVTQKTAEEKRDALYEHLDTVGMMAGKYILSGLELVHPDLEFIAEVRVSRYEYPAYVYLNKLAKPRIRLAKEVVALPHSSVRELIEADKEFDTEYLDCHSCSGSVSPNSKIDRIITKNGRFEIEVDASGDEWLVVSEQLLPGWYATIDDKPIPIVRANGLYMALFLPEGNHTVVMQYQGIRNEAQWLRKLGLFPYELLPKYEQ